jgi:flagellar hook-basal body complex protein FliE
MTINRLQNAGSSGIVNQNSRIGQEKAATKTSMPFSEVVEKAVNGVNEMQVQADQKSADLLSGKTDDVHDVSIAMQRSKLSFELMMEIRNKLLDTYKEVSRIQM